MTHRSLLASRLFALFALVTLLAGGWRPARAGDPPPPSTLAEKRRQEPNPFAGLSRQPPRAAVPLALQAAGGPDHFGYTWSSGGSLGWVEASGSSETVPFSDPDDALSAPVALGFSFKFYENTYSQVTVSTNGLLLFGEPTVSSTDEPIPLSYPPDNFLAPFADDLAVGGSLNGGTVYVLRGTSGGQQYIVFQWNRVTRQGETGLLTFEAILYENGSFSFKYQDLNGTLDRALVGIEDGDGVDGLTCLQNAPGLVAGTSLVFSRPPVAARVKLFSRFLSDFAINNQAAFSILIRNTGELGSDTYNLSAALASASHGMTWSAGLYLDGGGPALTDTNGDGKVDTGPVGQGGSVLVRVVLSAPAGAQVGDYTRFNFTAASALAPGSQDTLALQAAVPASFVQAYVDTRFGLGLDLVTTRSRTIARIADWFSGSTLALTNLAHSGYMYIWERNGQKASFLPYTDLEYALVDRSGSARRLRVKLTDHLHEGSETSQITDRYPVLAALPNGSVAVAWVRSITDFNTLLSNENVFLAILDENGNVLVPEQNLTQNTVWALQEDFDSPEFSLTALTATGDNRLVVSWMEGHTATNQKKRDIAYAVYDSLGQVIKPPALLTSSVTNVTGYEEPALAALDGSRAVIAFAQCDPAAQDRACTIQYAVLSSSGSLVRAPGPVPGSAGWRPDVLQLSSGPVVLAWTNTSSGGGMGYAIVDRFTLAVASGPGQLSDPNGRPGGYVSITRDENGRGILTWMDLYWNSFMYYALLDGSGQVLTPPMAFYPEANAHPFIYTSTAGQGNTRYEPLQVYLPVMTK